MPIPPEHLARVTLHGIETSLVKRLSGFQKHHTVPQRADDYHNAWIATLAHPELEGQLNDITRLLRTELNYKRKDIVAGLDGNTGMISTPTFTYTLTVELDPQNPMQIIWQREITEISKLDIIADPEFSEQIGDHYQQTQFHTASPVSIEALIDTLEENDVDLDYPHDAATCTLLLPQIQGHILLHPNGFTIHYPAPQLPHTLLYDLENILPLPTNDFINLLIGPDG